jgi:hypothetical protein
VALGAYRVGVLELMIPLHYRLGSTVVVRPSRFGVVPGSIPGLDRADDEGRTMNDMKSMLRHQGVEGMRRRYDVETSECSGGESTKASGPGKGLK